MKNKNQFEPDYTVLPCDTLNETLECLNITPKQFSSMSGIKLQVAEEVLTNKRKVDTEFATAFETHIGTSATLLLNLQKVYDVSPFKNILDWYELYDYEIGLK